MQARGLGRRILLGDRRCPRWGHPRPRQAKPYAHARPLRPASGHSVMITRSTATCQKPTSTVFTRAMTAFAKSWRRDLLPLGGVRLLHLLHQRAFGFRQRLKCLVRRDRGDKLVIVPCPLGFRRLLDLIQVHLVDHPAVLSDLSVLGK